MVAEAPLESLVVECEKNVRIVAEGDRLGLLCWSDILLEDGGRGVGDCVEEQDYHAIDYIVSD